MRVDEPVPLGGVSVLMHTPFLGAEGHNHRSLPVPSGTKYVGSEDDPVIHGDLGIALDEHVCDSSLGRHGHPPAFGHAWRLGWHPSTAPPHRPDASLASRLRLLARHN